jgi:heat shock protein HslJ
MRAFTVCVLTFVLLSCAPRSDAPDAAANEGVASAAARTGGISFEDIAGNWRIASINGGAARATREDQGGERTPRISFSPTSYGGTSGCNFFGGLGLLEGDRYYAAPGPQTAMGCGDLAAQEDGVTGIFWSAPKVGLAADGTLTLASGERRIVLRRDPSLPGDNTPAWGNVEPPSLAGTVWKISSIDGEWLGSPAREIGRTLRFEAGSWFGLAACATLSGGWSQQRDRILLAHRPSTTEQLCPAADAAIDGRLAALMAARPRFVTGPNGEILIAGGDHWLVGERRR